MLLLWVYRIRDHQLEGMDDVTVHSRIDTSMSATTCSTSVSYPSTAHDRSLLTTIKSAVAAVTLGPTVHSNVYGRSRLTGEKPLPFVSGILAVDTYA